MFYRPTSFWTWALVVLTVAETLVVLAIEGIIFAMFRDAQRPISKTTSESKAVPMFLSLLILGLLYQQLLVYDTLAHRNTIQLIGLCIYAACFCVYTGLQVTQLQVAIVALADLDFLLINDIWAKIGPLAIVNATATGAHMLVLSGISFKLYAEFQWTIYRQLNADLDMQKRYFLFQIYMTLLKFDFFFFVGFLLQNAVVVAGFTGTVEWSVVVAVVYTVIVLITSSWYVKRENRLATAILLGLQLVLLGYFIFRFTNMFSGNSYYLPVIKSLTYFAVITILLGAITVGVGITCMLNFNKGLKPHVSSNRLAEEWLGDHEMELSEI
ncbi:hypothetical protein BP5796_03522 [Coleophoma crateriformis]|uniref:Uncharacterized protein n=1 Tax=Coleophoma crateriformis TaxID=565419 RepID=A0A3D8SPV0_9HELO|nr:hypothetical protein BP5796_03522 [Coleophoma crateriformis]